MSRRPPLLGSLLIALTSLPLLATPALAQDPIPEGPQRDTTPSDPAAIGFLRSFVDRQVYTLGGAGAQVLTGQARVTAEIAGTKMVFQYQFEMDYRTNTPAIQQIGEPPTDPVERQFNEIIARQIVPSVFSPLPSNTASDDVIKLKRDGDLIRLDRRPRLKGDHLITSEWYDKNGKPLRTLIRVPALGTVEASEMQTTLETRELAPGKVAVVKEITRAAHRPEKVTTYRYAPVNGYLVLRQVRVESAGAVMVAEFLAEAEPARGKDDGKTP